MSRIRGRDTAPETLLRSALWARGLRYRVNARTPAGRADIVIKARKLAVFVDGCFWHGCPDHYVRPRSRELFWSKKLADNVARDVAQVLTLEDQGWCVVRIWEHEVHETLDAVVGRVLRADAEQSREAWRVFRVDADAGHEQMERRHLRELRGLAPDRFVLQRRHTRKWKRARRESGAQGIRDGGPG